MPRKAAHRAHSRALAAPAGVLAFWWAWQQGWDFLEVVLFSLSAMLGCLMGQAITPDLDLVEAQVGCISETVSYISWVVALSWLAWKWGHR